MEISQRNFWNKTNFQFGEESLKYTIKSDSQSSSFSVKYNAISTDPSEIQTKNSSTRIFGILFIVVGIVHVTLQFFKTGSVAFSLWFAIGLLFFVTYYLTKTAYTILQTEKYAIGIIKDSKHDKIYNEIITRRKNLFLSMYGEIDYENNPDDEMNKFIWLKNQNYISEEVFKRISKKISNYHKGVFKTDSIVNEKKNILN